MKKYLISIMSALTLLFCLLSSVSAEMTSHGCLPREVYIEVGQTIQLEPYYTTDDGTTRSFYYYTHEGTNDVFSYTDNGLVTGEKIGDGELRIGFREPDVWEFYYTVVPIHVREAAKDITVAQDHYDIYVHNWELKRGSYKLNLNAQINPDTYKPLLIAFWLKPFADFCGPLFQMLRDLAHFRAACPRGLLQSLHVGLKCYIIRL